ncbi:hypothetical protein BH24CHL9_BH24CHL9_13910 [soil metagenome]
MSIVSSGPVAQASPGLGTALRAAARDFFDHSWRLVAANVAWGLALLLVLAGLGLSPLALLLAPLLAVPTAGVYRLAALIARGERVSVTDGLVAWWRFGGRALVIGIPIALAVVALSTNVITGLGTGDRVGWTLATAAGWGLAAVATVCVVLWPLAVDPWREGLRLREVVRLALLLTLAFPVRFAVLALLVGMVFVLGSLAVVAVLSVAVAIAALISCRYVLPAADRLWPPPGRPPASSPEGSRS